MSGFLNPEVLDPTEWVSPSGRYRLLVDPTQRHGAGPGRYWLMCEAREVWSGERPFTFWKATVADDGTAAGCAYAGGLDEVDGPFVIALLGPDGTVRLREDTPRKHNLFSMPPDPQGLGLLLDPENDRLIVRVADPDINRHVESWWIYRLSTAAPWMRLEPKLLHSDAKPLSHIVAAQPLSGTDLILVQWWHYKPLKHRGAAFTLVDPTGRPVWRLDLPDDYEDPLDEDAARKMGYELAVRSALLAVGPFRRFTIRFARAQQAVTFAVEPTPSGDWTVSEVAFKPYLPPVPEHPSLEQFPLLRLEALGSITLRNPPGSPDPEIRDIELLAAASDGRLGFIRRPRQEQTDFVLVEESGQTRSLPLPQLPVEGGVTWRGCVWLGGDRFLVVQSSGIRGSKALAWWIDTKGRTVTPVLTALPAIQRVAPLPEGGFVALTFRNDSAVPLLCAYDVAGKPVWTLDSLYPFGVTEHSAEICLTPSGKIAILTSKRTVILLEPSGDLHGEVTLALDKQHSYAPEIRAWSGGFVLSGAADAWVFDAEGGLVRKLPSPDDDPERYPFSEFDIAPDGHLWATDRQVLRRLDLTGKLDRILAWTSDPDRLDVPLAALLGPDDRFYVLAARTYAVHVFDGKGRPLRVIQPLPTDRCGHLSPQAIPPITVDRQRNADEGPAAKIRHGQSRSSLHYLTFDADGLRRGPVTLVYSRGEYCRFQLQAERRWVSGRNGISLLDAEGHVLRTLEWRADGGWIRRRPSLAVSHDGSLAIFERSRSMVPEIAPPHQLSIISPDGDEIRTFAVPPSVGYICGLALGARYAVLIGGETGLFLNVDDGSIQRFELCGPAGPRAPAGQPFLNAAETELLLCESGRTFHRFRLPISQR